MAKGDRGSKKSTKGSAGGAKTEGRGRPKKAPADKRTATIKMSMTEKDKALVEGAATLKKMLPAEWSREVVTGRAKRSAKTFKVAVEVSVRGRVIVEVPESKRAAVLLFIDDAVDRARWPCLDDELPFSIDWMDALGQLPHFEVEDVEVL